MTLRLLVKKLELLNKKFITREELRKYCKELKIDYYTAIRYLTLNEYVIRILRGIFYVKSFEERGLKKIDISYGDAIKEALNIKGIKHWYFGLESAIKLNNLTHEYFTIETIMTDSIFRPKPIEILGVKVKFIKLIKKLFTFGIKRDDIRFSDVEKTILDMIYLGKYNNYSDEEIKRKILPLLEISKKNTLKTYAAHYPKTVQNLLNTVL